MDTTSTPDSPWTSRFRASKEESLQGAVLAAKEEEELELTSQVQRLNSLLIPPLRAHSSPNLDSLVTLHRALNLHPSDVSSSAILSRLDHLSAESSSLEIDLLRARQAVKVLAKEHAQLDLVHEDVTSLNSSLSSSRPQPTASSHEASLKDKKAEEYAATILRLQAQLDKTHAPDVSHLLERLGVLEGLEKRNEATKKEVGRYKGLPADYDLARLHVEEERRKLASRFARILVFRSFAAIRCFPFPSFLLPADSLPICLTWNFQRERQALRDDAMANALVSK